MRKNLRSTVVAACMGFALAVPAYAATAVQAEKTKSKKAAASQSKSAKFIRGSEESRAERTARLKRECKGGVNAGACTGYTD